MTRGAVARTVVVPLDGSDLAASVLVPATALATRLEARLELLTTAWDDTFGDPLRYLQRQAAAVALDDVTTEVDTRRNAPQAILHAASRPGAVVCMATHGRSGLREAVVGSTTSEVLRRSEHPVVLVGPELLARLSRFEAPNLLVALDGSQLAEAILPAAIEWAALLGAQPWFVQVVEPSGEARVGPDVVESAYLQGLAREAREQDGSFHWDVLHGDDPADALAEYARRLPASLLVMATHGRTGVAHLALGSVALRAAHRSPCPLLIARPRALHD